MYRPTDTATLLQEIRSVRSALEDLRVELHALRSEIFTPTTAKFRVRPYTVHEFARLISRHDEYVSDRCRAGLIKTLPGKPYRIPVSELKKWAGLSDADLAAV